MTKQCTDKTKSDLDYHRGFPEISSLANIWNSKDITNGNSHIWHQKYALPSTTVIGFVACGLTSKILGI